MSRSIIIGGVERWPDLEWGTLKINRVLTHQVDSCTFSIKGSQPAEGEEVIVEQDGTRLFAGIIIKVELSRKFPDQSVIVWDIECDDYTSLLDRRLVAETYENTTADWIFKDIVTKYCSGFTVAGVKSDAPTVEYIAFDYVKPSECFKQLCDYIGWHWQPDCYRDLQFFSAESLSTPAPIEITEATSGWYSFGKHSVNTQGLRNRVYVRGGTMLGDPQAVQWKADGVARIWVLPWGPHDITYGGVNGKIGVGEVAKSIGIENVDDETAKDYLLNYQEKYIRCSTQTSTPAAGTTISYMARQDIDVITMVEDLASQEAMKKVSFLNDGVWESTIVDDSLVTIEAAEAAGNADLRDHANPTVKGSFNTQVPGWQPGQLVQISLPDRGINATYLLQKVTLSTGNQELWTYTVEYGGRLLGIADFLKALVSAQQRKKLNETAILHKYIYGTDTAGVKDELIITSRALPYICGDSLAICGLVVVSNG